MGGRVEGGKCGGGGLEWAAGRGGKGWRPPCEPDRTQTIGQSQRCAGGCLAARSARHGARAFHSSGSRMHACTRSRPKFGAPPTHVPSMGPGARGSGRHMGWRWRCGEHLHAGPRGGGALGVWPWGGGGGRAHHSQSREPLGAIQRITLVGCATSLSFTCNHMQSHAITCNHLGGLSNELELLDDCNRRLELEQHPRRRDPKRLASRRLGYAKRSVCSHQRSSWGHHGVISGHQRSSGFISALISVVTWYASRPVFGGVEGP